MPSRRSILPLLAVAATAAVALPIMGAAAPGDLLPDLRSDPPNRPIVEPSGQRLLLRFDGFVTNVGRGPLDVTGNPSAGTMRQRESNGDGTWRNVGSPEVKYETADTHNHFHLMNVMRYSLRRADGNAQVAPAQKVGFCLYDIDRASGAPVEAPGGYSPANFCQRNNPSADSLSMGVSAGWRDVYDRDIALQWVDVSETPPGNYRLAAETDPFNVVVESNEQNNGMAFRSYTLPGHVAQPVGPVTIPGGAIPRAITLDAVTHGGGAAGARRFRILSAPAHGRLSIAVGGEIAGGEVLYTPAAGYSGPDSFRFAALSATGPTAGFPRNPASATATIQVGQRVVPTVSISGAPASLVAGTSAQLSAVVSPAGPVTWSASAGSIDGGGLFIAPGTPPAGGTVTVQATSVDDPTVVAAVAIGITPIPVPVPAVGSTGGGTSAVTGSNGLLVRPAVKRRGRMIVVRTMARVNGRLTVSAIRNRKVVARCTVRAKAGRRAACAVRLPAKLSQKTVRIAVGLKASGGRRSAARVLVRPRG